MGSKKERDRGKVEGGGKKGRGFRTSTYIFLWGGVLFQGGKGNHKKEQGLYKPSSLGSAKIVAFSLSRTSWGGRKKEKRDGELKKKEKEKSREGEKEKENIYRTCAVKEFR